MTDAVANFAASLVATAPSPATSGTSLVVTGGEGGVFPAVPFNAVLYPAGSLPTGSNAEIVRVTARSTDTLTITRAQEGTSAKTVAIGWVVSASITEKLIEDLAGLNPWLIRSATDAPHIVRQSAAGATTDIFQWRKQDDSVVAAIGPLGTFLEGGRRVAPITSRLTSVATIASATQTNIGIPIALLAAKVYRLKARGLWQTTATASTYAQRFNMGSGSITSIWSHSRVYTATGLTPAHQDGVAVAHQVASPTATAAATGTNYFWEWDGLIVVNAAGTLDLQHARVAGAGTITVAVGSYIEAQEWA